MTGSLVLIEPYADRLGGHPQRTLAALAAAKPGSLVIAPHGMAAEAVAVLRETGARLVTAPAGCRAAVLFAVGRFAAGLSATGQRVSALAAGPAYCGGCRTRSRWWPAA